MDEYISREATVKAFCEKCKGYYDGHCIHRGECDIDVIQTVPAADVQPVKHTENLSTFDFSDEFTCKNCGIHLAEWVKLDVEDYEEYEFKFCPNCGARIDGDAE